MKQKIWINEWLTTASFNKQVMIDNIIVFVPRHSWYELTIRTSSVYLSTNIMYPQLPVELESFLNQTIIRSHDEHILDQNCATLIFEPLKLAESRHRYNITGNCGISCESFYRVLWQCKDCRDTIFCRILVVGTGPFVKYSYVPTSGSLKSYIHGTLQQ